MQIRKSLSEGKDLHKNAFVELMGHLTLDKKLLLVYEQEV